jgi:hypothetical protein
MVLYLLGSVLTGKVRCQQLNSGRQAVGCRHRAWCTMAGLAQIDVEF